MLKRNAITKQEKQVGVNVEEESNYFVLLEGKPVKRLFVLHEDLDQTLTAAAEKLQKSKTRLVEDALVEYLDRRHLL